MSLNRCGTSQTADGFCLHERVCVRACVCDLAYIHVSHVVKWQANNRFKGFYLKRCVSCSKKVINHIPNVLLRLNNHFFISFFTSAFSLDLFLFLVPCCFHLISFLTLLHVSSLVSDARDPAVKFCISLL